MRVFLWGGLLATLVSAGWAAGSDSGSPKPPARAGASGSGGVVIGSRPASSEVLRAAAEPPPVQPPARIVLHGEPPHEVALGRWELRRLAVPGGDLRRLSLDAGFFNEALAAKDSSAAALPWAERGLEGLESAGRSLVAVDGLTPVLADGATTTTTYSAVGTLRTGAVLRPLVLDVRVLDPKPIRVSYTLRILMPGAEGGPPLATVEGEAILPRRGVLPRIKTDGLTPEQRLKAARERREARRKAEADALKKAGQAEAESATPAPAAP